MFLRFWGRFGVVDLSGFKTEILRFRRNPTFQEKSYVSGEILRFRRNPTFQEKSYVSREILRFRRNPMFQEKSYVSGEILCFRRNPMFLGRFGVVDLSGFKTEILRFRRKGRQE